MEPKPVKAIVASEIARLDSNVFTGGGTDVTEQLQAALDAAKTCDGVHLIMDGAALVRSLRIHSNTTIECRNRDCGFFQKEQSNRAILSNSHWDRHDLRDRNLSLIGGTYNQNCLHQEHDVVNDYKGQDRKCIDSDRRWVFGLEFYGVENLTVRDVIIRDFRTFGLTVGGFRNVLCENVWFDLPNRMHAQNQDGFHFWGPGRFLTVRNTGGRVGDDFMNIGPDEIDNVSSISDVLVDGVFLDDADQAIRMLTTGTGRLDRVTVRNVSGVYRSYGFYLNCWESKKTYGDFGNIFFENIDLRQTAPNYDYRKPMLFSIGGNVECMTFKNIRHHNPCDSRTLFEIGVPFCDMRFAPPADNKPRTQTIIIDGLTIIEDSAAAGNAEYVQVYGEIDRLMLQNVTVLRRASGERAGHLLVLKEHGRLGTLHLSNVYAHGFKTLIAGDERIQRTLSANVVEE